MKLFFQINVIIIIIIAGLFSVQANAESGDNNITRHAVGVDLGQVFLHGNNYGNKFNNSLGFGLRYNYAASDIFELEADISGSNHSDNAFKIMYSTLGLKTNFIYYDKLVPFATLGLGFYKPRIQVQGDTATKTAFGMRFGMGADLLLNEHVSIGVMMNYRNVFSSNAKLTNGTQFDISGAFSNFLMRLSYRI